MLELILQGSALLIQFLTFTFLVLFYAQMIYKGSLQWPKVKGRALFLYGLVNFLFTGAFVATIVVATTYGVDLDVIQNGHAFFVASMYMFLTISLGVFGWRLIYLVSVANVKIPFLKSKTQISILTVTLCFVFASRSVKDLLSGLSIGSFDLNDPHGQPLLMQAILFSVYVFWDIIPATLVLIFFWHIPGANNEPLAPVPAPYFSTINYSAEENAAFLDSPSVGAKVRAANQLYGNAPRLHSDNELGTPPSRTPLRDSMTSSNPGRSRPNFRQYAGYSTKSTLSSESISLPADMKATEQMNAALGIPVAKTPDV